MQFDNILAVIDPTTDTQIALQRAIAIAASSGANVKAYLCAFSTLETDDKEALERVETARQQAWLDKVIAETDCRDVEVTPHVQWDPDWREAVALAADELDCGVIVKSTYVHSAARRKLLKSSDLRLLRTAKCPIVLTKKPVGAEFKGLVLIALNLGADDEAHRKLNEAIIEAGNNVIRRRPEARLHAVNAYSGSDQFIHPPDLAKYAGIERDHAHVAEGPPEKVISEVAAELDADLVIIGTVARKGITGVTIGNTAERVLDQLDADVMTIVGQ